MAKALSADFWASVKKDYEKGLSQAELRKKYNLSPSSLANKIKRSGWEITQSQKEAISAFSEASGKISAEFGKANETQKAEIINRINTIIDDCEIMASNRHLAKRFQARILDGFNDGMFESSKDIKAGTSALKDLEYIANPKPSVEVNQSQSQSNALIKIEFVE